MSDNPGATQPQTLDEALQEIENLRSQLSGSDLKVFSQNRELKVQNADLKEQIQQLTEQCVTQTFSVRGLEKSVEGFQSKVAELESQIAQLESEKAALASEIETLKTKIGDLETHVTDLGGQLEDHKSKELNLSQELEKTIAQNAEALEKLKAEQEEAARKKAEELEKARVDYEAKVTAKQEAIKALEDRVEKFKEEFLSQEIAPVGSSANGSSGSGRAFEVLSSKMENFLGFPGRALVEQVFRLSGVEKTSDNSSELEETFEVLQDTAGQLIRSPEQEAELTKLLKDAWTEIGLGEGGQTRPATPEVAPPSSTVVESTEAPPSEESEKAEATPSTKDSVETPEQPSPQADEVSKTEEPEPPQEASDIAVESDHEPQIQEASNEPAAQTEATTPETEVTPAESESVEEDAAAAEPVQTEPASVEEETAAAETAQTEPAPVEEETAAAETAQTEPAPVEEDNTTPEPVQTEPTPVDEDTAGAEPAQTEPTPVEEVSQETIPEPVLDEQPVAEATAEDDSESENSDFEKAAALLEDGNHAEALPLFEALQQADPSESTFQVGRLACLANLGRFKEAYNLGKTLEGSDLGDSQEIFDESMDTALMGVASEAESDLLRKEFILELVQRTKASDQILAFLDEADEIAMRLANEGELSLLQAKHRISQDDVTEYLIDALHSLSDRSEVFSLLRTNLERYPELTPLSEFLERLLDSSRAESLEAESQVKELLGQGDSVEELLDEADPGEEAVVQVFLEHLLPRSEVKLDIPSEDFEELMLEAEPAAFVGSLRQALRSVDYTVFFDEIEVLSYDGDDHFLLRSSPEPTPTLLFGAELDDVPPEELRFLVLRELFSMYRRHSQLAHISAGLDDQKRVKLVRACIDIFSEFEAKVPPETLATLDTIAESAKEGGHDPEFKAGIEAFLREVYIRTESDSFLELGDFLYGGQLNRKWLDSISDGFAAKQTGIVVASYAISRDLLSEDDFEQLEEQGFGWLYSPENRDKYAELRLRLQRLWTTPLKALISEPEE